MKIENESFRKQLLWKCGIRNERIGWENIKGRLDNDWRIRKWIKDNGSG
jgi:hypothetical protein